MGFPSPAADYVESRISLDQQIIRHPSATYFMRAADSHHREGILQGALLVVDSSITPVDGSLLVCAIEGEYRVKRYRKYPRRHDCLSPDAGKAEWLNQQQSTKPIREPSKHHPVCVSWSLYLMLRKLKCWSVTVPRVASGVRLASLVSTSRY